MLSVSSALFLLCCSITIADQSSATPINKPGMSTALLKIFNKFIFHDSVSGRRSFGKFNPILEQMLSEAQAEAVATQVLALANRNGVSDDEMTNRYICCDV